MPSGATVLQVMFARQTAAESDAVRVASLASAIWNDAATALSPIIGRHGVDALFKRSIYLTRSAHPLLTSVFEDKSQSDAFAHLQALLARQTSAAAVAANITLLQNFQDLLTTLIGLSLTERLLRPVWDKPSSGQAEQDLTS